MWSLAVAFVSFLAAIVIGILASRRRRILWSLTELRLPDPAARALGSALPGTSISLVRITFFVWAPDDILNADYAGLRAGVVLTAPTSTSYLSMDVRRGAPDLHVQQDAAGFLVRGPLPHRTEMQLSFLMDSDFASEMSVDLVGVRNTSLHRALTPEFARRGLAATTIRRMSFYVTLGGISGALGTVQGVRGMETDPSQLPATAQAYLTALSILFAASSVFGLYVIANRLISRVARYAFNRHTARVSARGRHLTGRYEMAVKRRGS